MRTDILTFLPGSLEPILLPCYTHAQGLWLMGCPLPLTPDPPHSPHIYSLIQPNLGVPGDWNKHLFCPQPPSQLSRAGLLRMMRSSHPRAPDLLWVQPQSLTLRVKSSASAFAPWRWWGNGPLPPSLLCQKPCSHGDLEAATSSCLATVHPGAPHSS